MQLIGWVKELLAETKIQLNFAEERAAGGIAHCRYAGARPLRTTDGRRDGQRHPRQRPEKVYVERRGKLELTDVTFRDHAHLLSTCVKIVNRIGRRVDELHPQVDARLPDGSRINVVIPPLAIDGAMLSDP